MNKSAASQEAALKKKLQVFLADLSRFGTTRGFKHFTCYIRGKEELVISIKNNLPSSPTVASSLQLQVPRKQSLKHTDSLNSSNLPYEKTKLTLSHSTQLGLSGMRDAGIGLPPASPSEEDPLPTEDVTNFLIAGYSRYSCPYVWVRSNHERLMKMTSAGDSVRDAPLRLKSTLLWHESDVFVFEIIAELVKLCMFPAPRNPFELDFAYFRNLKHPFQLLATSAMMSFLDKVITHSQDSRPYTGKVFEEHQLLSKLHFTSLSELVESGTVPILADQKKEIQKTHGTSTALRSDRQLKSFPPRHRTPLSASSSSSTSNFAATQQQTPAAQCFVRSTTPVNTPGAVRYGQGAAGAFPGGFDRMPAPSMF